MKKLVHKSNIGEILQRIYDSEINAGICSFSFGGFCYSTEIGCYPEEKVEGMQLADTQEIEVAMGYLVVDIMTKHPTSKFTKWASSVELGSPLPPSPTK